jgi:hypothetical protein
MHTATPGVACHLFPAEDFQHFRDSSLCAVFGAFFKCNQRHTFVLIVLFLVKTLFSPHYIIITNEKRTGSGLALRRDVWSRDVSSTPVLSGSDVWRDDWSFPMTVYNRGYGSSRRYGRGGYGMGGYGGYGGVSSLLSSP